MNKPVSTNLVTLRLSDAELAQIDRAATTEGVSRNEWIRRECAARAEDVIVDDERTRSTLAIILRQVLLQRCALESHLFEVHSSDVADGIIREAKRATAKFLDERGLGENLAKGTVEKAEFDA